MNVEPRLGCTLMSSTNGSEENRTPPKHCSLSLCPYEWRERGFHAECYWLRVRRRRETANVSFENDALEITLHAAQPTDRSSTQRKKNKQKKTRDAVKKAPAHWKMNFDLPRMHGNSYTSTWTETHLVCPKQCKKKQVAGKGCTEKINSFFGAIGRAAVILGCFYAVQGKGVTILLPQRQKAFSWRAVLKGRGGEDRRAGRWHVCEGEGGADAEGVARAMSCKIKEKNSQRQQRHISFIQEMSKCQGGMWVNFIFCLFVWGVFGERWKRQARSNTEKAKAKAEE